MLKLIGKKKLQFYAQKNCLSKLMGYTYRPGVRVHNWIFFHFSTKTYVVGTQKRRFF